MWANIGAFHICLWTFTMTEAWAWGREEDELVNRKASPWDDPNRRPSHADKRRAWRRELLAEEIRAVLRPGVTEEEIRAVAERLLAWPHESETIAESTGPPKMAACHPSWRTNWASAPIKKFDLPEAVARFGDILNGERPIVEIGPRSLFANPAVGVRQ